MRLKNFFKGIGVYAAAEVLCLFLALTLSAVGGSLLRLVSMVCTLGMLCCLCINYGWNRAKEDQKQKCDGVIWRGAVYGGVVSLPYILCGVFLCLARAGVVSASGYRWYKLADAPFLQLCNLFSQDITALSLTWGETVFLALCNLLPLVVVWLTYVLCQKGVVPEEFLYRRS